MIQAKNTSKKGSRCIILILSRNIFTKNDFKTRKSWTFKYVHVATSKMEAFSTLSTILMDKKKNTKNNLKLLDVLTHINHSP